MKKILMIANFTSLPSENGNSRFTYLASCLKDNNKLELITSSFHHSKKIQREFDDKLSNEYGYKITLINEPGYKKNVSIKRFYSHYVMSKNLKQYLNKLEYKPDIIYCAVPSLDVAKVATKYAKKNNIRFIIDIQDLWPEAFKMIINIPIISDLVFFPMKRIANYIYKNANDIIAVSETYLNRTTSVNNNAKNKLNVFLGTDLEYFDKFREKENNKKDNMINIGYVGTLGHSYDIKCIIDAINILNNKNIIDINFTILGDGPLKQEFENYAKEKNICCEFTGRLQYEEMIKKLTSFDIAVNPIKKGSAGSIINKVGDYAAAGLPVINTQESEEYRNLVDRYSIGFNCENGNAEDVACKIEKLYNDKELRITMGKNNRKLAEEKFDRKKTYANIIKIIGE